MNEFFDLKSLLGGASAEEAKAIREAVANASTLEEVERLNQMLRAGIVPGKTNNQTKTTNGKNLIKKLFSYLCYFEVFAKVTPKKRKKMKQWKLNRCETQR